MPKPEKNPAGALVQAALALEEELRGFDQAAREAQRLPLTSQKNLERTTERLGELASAEGRVGPLVAALQAAVRDMAEKQRAQAEALAARSAEVERRREELVALLEKYAEVGREASGVNQLALEVLGAAKGGSSSADPPGVDAVRARLERLADRAGELEREATERGFEDLAAQAQGLRQQLRAVVNRIGLLAGKIADGRPMN
jgi:hypothetical protein